MTDGPLISFTVYDYTTGVEKSIGNTLAVGADTNLGIDIRGASSPEFGSTIYYTLWYGVINENESIIDSGSFPAYPSGLDWIYINTADFPIYNQPGYFRIEANSTDSNGVTHRAYTHPIWIDVVPYCPASQGSSFSIQQTCVTDPFPPEAPTLVWPGPSETIADSTPTFVWNRPNDTGSGVDYYQIDVDGTVNFYGDTSLQPSYAWPTTLSNGPHTWKVQARDGAGNYGNWSETRTFIVDTSNDQQITAGTISETHACDSITVTATYSGDVDNDGSATLDYKLSSSGTWGGEIAMIDQGTQYLETISGLSESTNYDVRVTYNDPDGVVGANPQTITAINTGSCPVNNPPYDVVIESPADGATYNLGDTITFDSKLPRDPEDGWLPDTASIWTSSIDGYLDIGWYFTRTDLSSGTHTITLNVTDSQGASTTDQVTITVNQPGGGETNDLAVSNLYTNPLYPIEDEYFKIYYTVTNEGQNPETIINVNLYVDGSKVSSQFADGPLETQTITYLAPGESQQDYFYISRSEGSYPLIVEVEQVVGEGDLTDNNISSTVDVGPPGLRIDIQNPDGGELIEPGSSSEYIFWTISTNPDDNWNIYWGRTSNPGVWTPIVTGYDVNLYTEWDVST